MVIPLGFLAKESVLGHGADNVGACFEGEERPAFPIHHGPCAIFTGEDCVSEEPSDEAVDAAIGRLLNLLGYKNAATWRYLALMYIYGQVDALIETFLSSTPVLAFVDNDQGETLRRRLAICDFFEKLRACLKKFGGNYLEIADYYREEIVRGARRRGAGGDWYRMLGASLGLKLES